MPQFEFVRLADGDVGLRPGNAAGLAGFITNGDSPDEHPGGGALLLEHAAFRLDLVAFAFEMGAERSLKPLDIFLVQAAKPFLRAVSNLVLMAAEHGCQAGRQVQLVGRQIPVPEPIFRAPSRKLVTFFALPQRLFHPLAPDDFSLKILVGGLKLSGSLLDPRLKTSVCVSNFLLYLPSLQAQYRYHPDGKDGEKAVDQDYP